MNAPKFGERLTGNADANAEPNRKQPKFIDNFIRLLYNCVQRRYEMDIVTLGYLAGFIDGEGSLIINKREHVDYKGKRYIGYSAYLDIGNTNKEVLLWIKSKVGATSKVYENQMSGNRKLAYRLRIGYKQAFPLIKELQSLLIVKREIASTFLQYKDSKDREELFIKAKALNKRGIL